MRAYRKQPALFGGPRERRSKRDDTVEKEIQQACMDWLNSLPGVKMWRQNRGAILSSYTSVRTGITKKRMVKFGLEGACDSTGAGPHGIRIEIEYKRPGEYPDLEQIAYMEMIRSTGAIAFWCDSLASCIKQLRYEFQQRNWPWKESWEVR